MEKKNKRKTKEKFVIEAVSIHGQKYNYDIVDYINNRTKVKIVCPIHGEFKQTPYNHIGLGQGCPDCGGTRQLTVEFFIEKAKKTHNNKYDYSLVEYINNRTKVKIICKEHGVFEQRPDAHLKGQNCSECANILLGLSKLSNTDDFIKKAALAHNYKYDYSLVDYRNNFDKVKIICKEHGVFEQNPFNHLRGHGCPDCSFFISKPEIDLLNFIKLSINNTIITNSRSIISPYELDMVIPSKKIAIEYNGIYWHSEQRGKNKKYHLKKYELCKEMGYRLIQVWENEWLQKKDIVKSIILSALGIYERKIHGRKCIISPVDNSTARYFYEENHIQGFKIGSHHGLYIDGELVSLMTINNSTNILERFANKINCLVYGAFSKLLKSFDNIDGLVTFADLRYFTGDVYRKNGFVYQYTSEPNYFYFKSDELFSRVKFQKHKLEKLLEKFDPNLTEYQNMLANGYDRIWDCGNLKFLLTFPQNMV